MSTLHLKTIPPPLFRYHETDDLVYMWVLCSWKALIQRCKVSENKEEWRVDVLTTLTVYTTVLPQFQIGFNRSRSDVDQIHLPKWITVITIELQSSCKCGQGLCFICSDKHKVDLEHVRLGSFSLFQLLPELEEGVLFQPAAELVELDLDQHFVFISTFLPTYQVVVILPQGICVFS